MRMVSERRFPTTPAGVARVIAKLRNNLKYLLAVIVLFPLLVIMADISSRNGEIARNVTIAGIEVGGLSPEDATVAVLEYEAALRNEPALITVKDTTFQLDPKSVDLVLNTDEVVEEALLQRRESGLIGQVIGWLSSFGDTRTIDVAVTIDPVLLDQQIDQWQQNAISIPAYEGAVVMAGGFAKPEYPALGEGIDRAA